MGLPFSEWADITLGPQRIGNMDSIRAYPAESTVSSSSNGGFQKPPSAFFGLHFPTPGVNVCCNKVAAFVRLIGTTPSRHDPKVFMFITKARPLARRLVLLPAALVLLCAASHGDDGPSQGPNFSNDPKARELVRRVVANELEQEARDKSHYMFRLKRVTPKGTSLKEIVQTDQGSVARTLLIDGKAPTEDQKRSEQDKITKLANDPDAQRQRMKREKEDENRAQIMIKALPNAFFYQEIGRDGDIIKLRFRPDPNYEPASREESVYTGMAGELWLNIPQQRLRKIDAQLFHDVDFGWGILGRLYRGGSFMVEQEQVDGTHWDTTVMKLDLTGKALIFKSLVYKEQEYESDFKRLPDHLTMAQGVEILKKGATEMAEKEGQ